MAMDFRKLNEMLELVSKDIALTDYRTRILNQSWDVMRKCPIHKKHPEFALCFRRVVQDSLLMAIRRHTDVDTRSYSLLRIITSVRDADRILRKQFKRRIKLSTVVSDTLRVSEIRKKIKVADKRIAHLDSQYTHQPQRIRPILNQLIRILDRYSLLISGNSYSDIFVYDTAWDTIFSVPWRK